eukprot:TRINITY_DN123_c0_g2_i6.p1 TRINITY_DN123_c0_g2~~TRINITY_DN123_c0_g2_i6.p1  ORF type:complete len:1538 (+),score=546.92 TRINITY_DN123_c0_g2_i6:56-4669(+)
MADPRRSAQAPTGVAARDGELRLMASEHTGGFRWPQDLDIEADLQFQGAHEDASTHASPRNSTREDSGDMLLSGFRAARGDKEARAANPAEVRQHAGAARAWVQRVRSSRFFACLCAVHEDTVVENSPAVPVKVAEDASKLENGDIETNCVASSIFQDEEIRLKGWSYPTVEELRSLQEEIENLMAQVEHWDNALRKTDEQPLEQPEKPPMKSRSTRGAKATQPPQDRSTGGKRSTKPVGKPSENSNAALPELLSQGQQRPAAEELQAATTARVDAKADDESESSLLEALDSVLRKSDLLLEESQLDESQELSARASTAVSEEMRFRELAAVEREELERRHKKELEAAVAQAMEIKVHHTEALEAPHACEVGKLTRECSRLEAELQSLGNVLRETRRGGKQAAQQVEQTAGEDSGNADGTGEMPGEKTAEEGGEAQEQQGKEGEAEQKPEERAARLGELSKELQGKLEAQLTLQTAAMEALNPTDERQRKRREVLAKDVEGLQAQLGSVQEAQKQAEELAACEDASAEAQKEESIRNSLGDSGNFLQRLLERELNSRLQAIKTMEGDKTEEEEQLEMLLSENSHLQQELQRVLAEAVRASEEKEELAEQYESLKAMHEGVQKILEKKRVSLDGFNDFFEVQAEDIGRNSSSSEDETDDDRPFMGPKMTRMDTEGQWDESPKHQEMATKIQAGYRGCLARKLLKSHTEDLNAQLAKAKQEREEAEAQKKAHEERRRVTDEQKEAEEKLKQEKAVRLQSMFRGQKGRWTADRLRKNREFMEREEERRKLRLERQQREEKAAIKIQAVERGRLGRQRVGEIRKEQEAKRRELQRQHTKRLQRSETQKLETKAKEVAAVVIQASWRGLKASRWMAVMRQERRRRQQEIERRKQLLESKEREEVAQRGRREAAAVRIQATQRGRTARQRTTRMVADEQERQAELERLAKLREAHEKAQEASRRKLEEAALLATAAKRIQAAHRGRAARRVLQTQKEEDARQRQEMLRLARLREEAAKSRAAQEQSSQLKEASAVKIQSAMRSYLVRHSTAEDREAMARRTAERQWLDKLLEEKAQSREAQAALQKQREASAVKLQAAMRGYLARHSTTNTEAMARKTAERQWLVKLLQEKSQNREAQEALLKQHEAAAVRLQAAMRGHLARHSTSTAEARARRAAERQWLAKLLEDKAQSREAQAELRKQQEAAAVKLQAVVRGSIVRTATKERKQALARHERELDRLARLKEEAAEAALARRPMELAAAQRLQAAWRGLKGRKQASWRRLLLEKQTSRLARDCRKERRREEALVVRLQAAWRGHRCRQANPIAVAKTAQEAARQARAEERRQKHKERQQQKRGNEAAVVRLQAFARGFLVRKELGGRRRDANLQRREIARRNVKMAEAEQASMRENMRREAAATRLQAFQRGRQARAQAVSMYQAQQTLDRLSSAPSSTRTPSEVTSDVQPGANPEAARQRHRARLSELSGQAAALAQKLRERSASGGCFREGTQAVAEIPDLMAKIAAAQQRLALARCSTGGLQPRPMPS